MIVEARVHRNPFSSASADGQVCGSVDKPLQLKSPGHKPSRFQGLPEGWLRASKEAETRSGVPAFLGCCRSVLSACAAPCLNCPEAVRRRRRR